jgi:parvulin-like peptidyl-prolyl isomerase
MIPKKPILCRAVTALAGLALLLAACKGAPTAQPVGPAPTNPDGATAAPAATLPPEPTATMAPLAALVNGQGILLSDFEAELSRYQQAHPNDTQGQDAQRKAVLDDLIGQSLLAQAAQEGGYQPDDAAMKTRLDDLNKQAGGGPALTNWIKANGYTEETFKSSLRQSIMAAWERDKIIAAVPQTAEQVHARQILVQDEGTANDIESRLKNGQDFATLAAAYDPVTGGELGWFPKGYLTQPEVEAAAFALQPKEYSPVIKSAIGYHIIQVIERDPQHPLGADARRALQEKALQDWLQQRRSQAKIEILLK